MFFSTIILICACWQQVVGQFENGIIFSSAQKPATTPSSTQATIIIPGGNCSCILAAVCPNPAPTIDIRIVNTDTNYACPAAYVLCCSGKQNEPTITDSTCGIKKIQPTAQPAIGQASFGAYPWQAAFLTLQEAYIGSGVLLDATHVLTVAHKVVSYINNPAAMLVRLGEWDARATTEPYQFVQVAVAKITTHPSYNAKTLENNIAVVRLNGVVPIASYPNINTACKPTAPPATGTRCYVSGWGKNLFGSGGSYQSIMREVDIPILDPTDCENRFKQTRLGVSYALNKMSFLCAGGEPGKDACTGDGGSPLVCQGANGQWTVYGLVAWGIGCANSGVPGVYTNVFNFMPWINTALTQ